jgi:hypothetical protein
LGGSEGPNRKGFADWNPKTDYSDYKITPVNIRPQLESSAARKMKHARTPQNLRPIPAKKKTTITFESYN